MNKIYIVRYGNGSNEPESYIFGLYPTEQLAENRIDVMTNEGFDPDEIWIDMVEVGTQGADCFLSNR
jgi:hypothetical protein